MQLDEQIYRLKSQSLQVMITMVEILGHLMLCHPGLKTRVCLVSLSVLLCTGKWDTTTDVMPINFFIPALLNLALVIAAIAAVVGRKDTCPDTSAHKAYQALRWGLFSFFVLSAAVELGIVIGGLQGVAPQLCIWHSQDLQVAGTISNVIQRPRLKAACPEFLCCDMLEAQLVWSITLPHGSPDSEWHALHTPAMGPQSTSALFNNSQPDSQAHSLVMCRPAAQPPVRPMESACVQGRRWRSPSAGWWCPASTASWACMQWSSSSSVSPPLLPVLLLCQKVLDSLSHGCNATVAEGRLTLPVSSNACFASCDQNRDCGFLVKIELTLRPMSSMYVAQVCGSLSRGCNLHLTPTVSSASLASDCIREPLLKPCMLDVQSMGRPSSILCIQLAPWITRQGT